MGCKSCLVEELKFEVKVEGEHNLPFLPEIVSHLKRKRITVEAEDNRLWINEPGMRDFYDFCQDHMEADCIFYRLEDQPWKSISEVLHILDKQWIDEIIQKEWITCHFQPIVNAEEEIYAYEILSRFYKADGTVLYPNEVFKAASERGRLYALDRACRMAAVKSSVVLQKKAFINFMPTSIYSPEFCLKTTISLANQLGIDPGNFVFEVVETEKVDDINHLKSILHYYRERGFQYALDDVGEGYSTIELLGELTPHFMKLDLKYVQGIANDEEKQQGAKMFLEKAVEIGSIPLAEGVEEREDFEWLRENGYQLFQGYLFGKPSPVPKRDLKVSDVV